MSTRAPAPRSDDADAEHSVWHGERVDGETLAEQLRELNRRHAHHGHGHGATRTLNLLVAAGDDVPSATLRARLRGLRTRHPSRTLVVREHALAQLDATVAVECGRSDAPGRAGYCHDGAELIADERRLRHADSLVRPLRVAGLPTVLWLPGAQPSPAERPLARLADAIVLDSGAAADVAAAFARADALGAERVRDLEWLRLVRWRQRLAAHFDSAEERALLGAIERIELRCGWSDTAAALLLGGWIAARVGWTLTALACREGAWRGSGRRRDGGAATLLLGPAAGVLPGIEALALHAPQRTIALREPVAEPDAARAFAAALRAFDEPAAGYPLALATLLEGLRAR